MDTGVHPTVCTRCDSLVVYAASSYFVDAGPKFASDWLATLLGGAVLALAYCSPIALRFAPASVGSPAH